MTQPHGWPDASVNTIRDLAMMSGAVLRPAVQETSDLASQHALSEAVVALIRLYGRSNTAHVLNFVAASLVKDQPAVAGGK
jgi:hypothetical protein